MKSFYREYIQKAALKEIFCGQTKNYMIVKQENKIGGKLLSQVYREINTCSRNGFQKVCSKKNQTKNNWAI